MQSKLHGLQISPIEGSQGCLNKGGGLFEHRGGRGCSNKGGGEGCLEETAVVVGGGCGCRKGASLKKDKAGGGLGVRAQRLPPRLW